MWSTIASKSRGALGKREGQNNLEVAVRSRKIFIPSPAPRIHEGSVRQDGEKMPSALRARDSDRIQVGEK